MCELATGPVGPNVIATTRAQVEPRSGAGAELSKPFQVLSLDGGGVRGIFEAALLAALEIDLGISVVDCFDLVVGTSTGGILALGLGAGISPTQILDFYVDHQSRIFANPLRWRNIRRLWRAKYPAARLEQPLREIFGDRLLGESRVPLVIPTYNIGVNAVCLLKTPHNERLRRDHRLPMWEAAMATAAAPTFFPAVCLVQNGDRLVDGGLWANNPTLVGIAEAASLFGRSLNEIKVLSIGTLIGAETRRSKLDQGGFAAWGRSPNLVSVLLAAQGAGALGLAEHLIGKDNLFRLDATAPDDLIALDRCEPRELIARASHESRMFSPTFQKAFASHTPPPYRPYYGPNSRQVAHAPS
jgi:patatin-like phospholipase/acyl hydrolase